MNQGRSANRPIATALLAILVAVSGCSESDNADAISASADNTLRRANIADPATLDPGQAESISTNNVMYDLFEGLVRESPSGDIEPAVAISWQILDDGKTYRFALRTDARWSDGSQLTAEDFVTALRRTVDPASNSTYASLLAPIGNAAAITAGEAEPKTLAVSALDDHTLEIRLAKPAPYFLGLLQTPPTFPVPTKALESLGQSLYRQENLISNGAYRIDSWRVGDRLTVVRNEYYWDADNVAIDKVEFLPIEDASTELTLFRAGELDITSTVPNSMFAELKRRDPAQLHTKSLLGTYFLGLDTTQPPLDNPLLREALSIAIDRADLADVVLGGINVGAWGFVPPELPGYVNATYSWQSLPREAQLAKAKSLYRQAGYSEANPLKIDLLYNTSDNQRKIMLAVQEMWRRNLGVQATLLNQEWKVLLQTRKQFGDWDVIRFGWTGDYADASNFLEIFRTANALNVAGWSNARFDALLNAAAVELSPSVRADLLRDAEALLLESYPMIPLYFYTSKHLVSDRIRGFSPTVMDRYYSRHMRLLPAE